MSTRPNPQDIAPEDCPEPGYHKTFNYCPACSWVREPNCDSYAAVDFGHGPKVIRCTRMDEHDEHRCEVRWSADL